MPLFLVCWGLFSMRCATLYRRKKLLIVHALSKTVDGVWVLTSPCETLSEDSSAALIGEAILRCLERSRSGIPDPKSFGDLSKPLLEAAGVKTLATFEKTAIAVEIEQENSGEDIVLLPTQNMGEDGFVPTNDRVQARVAPDSVGTEALRALGQAS